MTEDALPRRRFGDHRPKSDHDLLVQIAGDVVSILERQVKTEHGLEDLRRRFDAHLTEAAVRDNRIASLAAEGIDDGTDIEALKNWRSEMRGAWKVVQVAITLLGVMTGLSLFLQFVAFTMMGR